MHRYELISQETADQQTAEALLEAGSKIRLFGFAGAAVTGLVTATIAGLATSSPLKGAAVGCVAAVVSAFVTVATALVVENPRVPGKNTRQASRSRTHNP